MYTLKRAHWHPRTARVLALLTALEYSGYSPADARADEAARPCVDFSDPALLEADNRAGATLVSDLRRRGGGYVLPPNAGTVTLTEVELNENNGLCDQMQSLQVQARQLAQEIGRLAYEGGPSESELTLLQRERDGADRNAAQFSDYAAMRRSAEGAAWDADDLGARIRELESEPCEILRCASVDAEVAELSRALAALEAETAAQLARADEREAAYWAAVVARETFDEAISERRIDWDDRLARIGAAHRLITDMYATYARLRGGMANIRYESNWDRAVDTLREDNPGLWFERIATRAARVHAALVTGIGVDSYLAGLPAVLDYSVRGASNTPSGPVADLASYPASIEAELTLSLVATCVQREPEEYDVEMLDGGVPTFTVSVSYEYPTTSARDVSVGYDLYVLYRTLQRLAAGARDRSALLAEAKATNAIAFNWGATEVEPAARARFEIEVLEQLLCQVSARIAAPVYDASVLTEPVSSRPPDSVSVVTAPVADLVTALGAASWQSDLNGVILAVPAPAIERVETLAEQALGRLAALVTQSRSGGGDGTGSRRLPHVYLAKASGSEPSTERVLSKGTLDALQTLAEEPPASMMLPPAALQPVFAGAVTNGARRVVLDSLRLTRRAMDAGCGWFTLDCDGVAWVPRPDLTAQQLRAELEGWQTVSLARDAVSFRTGATLFIPGRPVQVLGGGTVIGAGLAPPSPPPAPTPPPAATPPRPSPPMDRRPPCSGMRHCMLP